MAAYNKMFEEMKALYSCCDSTIDSMLISEALFSKYPEHKNIIISYRDSINYPDNIDISSKLSSLDSVYFADTKDDALALKNDLCSRSTDNIYSKTLDRIIGRKHNRYGDPTLRYKSQAYRDKEYAVRRCPHCGIGMRMPEGTYYVICGYPDTYKGYDWRGCCNDWCFNCSKILCKSWEKDKLNIETNRFHDDECCKTHAKRNGFEYPKDYCHCILNKNIARKEIELSF